MLSIVSTWALVVVGAVAPNAIQGDVPTKTDPATVQRVLDARDLRSVYLDLVGRPPFQAERVLWIGKPLEALADEMLEASETWNHWLDEQLYYFLLVNNFRPESERVATIPADLARHKLEVREAIHRIALCPNFDQRNPGADTFVTVVMEQIGGLDVKKNARELEIGKKIYDGGEGVFLGVAGKSQSDVVRIAVESRQAARHFLAREYERCLHARPDAKQLAAWTNEFARDPGAFRGLWRTWITSAAYEVRLAARRFQPNRLFVRSLFVDLMDRLPTSEEAEPMREALDGLSDPAPLRAVLVRMMLDSGRVKLAKRGDIPDPESWIQSLFPRFLGRVGQASEVSALLDALRDPACRPETVIAAILSSPEYQQY